jgi:hypothetical protein
MAFSRHLGSCCKSSRWNDLEVISETINLGSVVLVLDLVFDSVEQEEEL